MTKIGSEKSKTDGQNPIKEIGKLMLAAILGGFIAQLGILIFLMWELPFLGPIDVDRRAFVDLILATLAATLGATAIALTLGGLAVSVLALTGISNLRSAVLSDAMEHTKSELRKRLSNNKLQQHILTLAETGKLNPAFEVAARTVTNNGRSTTFDDDEDVNHNEY